VAELRQRGLSEEESFWLARRRLGSPQPLAEEFIKEDPTRGWRKRLFWVLLAQLMIQLCSSVSTTVFMAVAHFDRILPQRVVSDLPLWLQNVCWWTGRNGFPIVYYLPLVAFLGAFALGPVICQALAKRPFLRDRWRFLSVTTILVFGIHLLHAVVIRMASAPSAGGVRWQSESLEVITCMGVIGIAAWLLPSQGNLVSTQLQAD
jgi:hypothetical protein